MSYRVHYFQHVEFEGLGNIQPILEARGCELSSTRWFADDSPSSPDHYDCLIVMGGPMGIYDYGQYPWLKAEKDAIKAAITAGKTVLGICLGAQLIADVLGATVRKNPQREIGWFSVNRDLGVAKTVLREVFPETFKPLHWHGDTFTLPSGATPIGASEACVHQGFVVNDRVVGLQFHLELNPSSVQTLAQACANELDDSEYVQTLPQMLSADTDFSAATVMLDKLLHALLPKISG